MSPARPGLCLVLLLALSPWASSPRAVANDLVGGDFEKPEKARQGETIELEGFVSAGSKNAVTRFLAPPPHERAVALLRGASLEATVTVPATMPAADKVPAEGWYGVASVDVLGLTKAGKATLTLSISEPGGKRALATADAKIAHVAPKGGKTATTVAVQRHWVQRLWVKVPSEVFRAYHGKPLVVRLEAEGSARVVIDNLRFDRFHDVPDRPLVGKPNGKNGPDLLASGALGFTGLTEHLKTAFSVLLLREGGSAEKAGLQRSDLVVAIEGVPLPPSSLAAGEAWFEDSHEAHLGRAIETALREKRRHIVLTVLRDKGPVDLKCKLPLKASFGDTFPYDDLAGRLREDMLRWIEEAQHKKGAWPGSSAVNPFLAGLALLGTRDRAHRGALKKLAGWMLTTNPTAADTKGFSFWSIAFQGIFLCEYYLASGDKRALAWIENAIEWLPSTTHESKWGMQAFGHSPKGLPYDNKALMGPCAHLLVFDALAEICGVKSGVWKHLEPYVMHSWSDPKKKDGHGGMGYNASYKDTAEFWSRTGLVALALKLRGHRKDMQKALTGIMVERHPWMLNSHAYGEPGAALGLIGLAAVDPKGFAQVMPAWRWRFVNAWEPGFGLRYSSPHMGSPYMGEEEIVNPAYALLFSLRNQGLVITGGEPTRWLAGR
jgi:hypothetical protein